MPEVWSTARAGHRSRRLHRVSTLHSANPPRRARGSAMTPRTRIWEFIGAPIVLIVLLGGLRVSLGEVVRAVVR